MQSTGQIIDGNQYYLAAMPPQATIAPQPGVSYQYAGGFYAEPYVMTQSPTQTAQPVMMPVGHPGFIYMQPSANPVYYSVPAAPTVPTTTPYFYASDIYVQQSYAVPQPMIQSNAVLPAEPSMPRSRSAVRPLSTSTPLPTETPIVLPQMNSQVSAYNGNVNTVQQKYQRNADHDDVLADLSKISILSEETVGGDSEKDLERPPRQRRPPPVPFNYKTRMCITFASGRHCEMGTRCKFAHGPEELRVLDQPPRPPNTRYKTKLCKNFGPFSSNYCPYGLRCEFIHPSDKEYALVASSMHRSARGLNHVDSLSQNACNVTPETLCDEPPISVTRSAVKPAVEKILLKNRNVAGSMMCLASTGRRDHASDDSAIGSGSSENGGSLAQVRTVARAREGVEVPNVPMKFLRRRSMSQMTLKRFNSIENLDVAASCSQLANLDRNPSTMRVFSPMK